MKALLVRDSGHVCGVDYFHQPFGRCYGVTEASATLKVTDLT